MYCHFLWFTVCSSENYVGDLCVFLLTLSVASECCGFLQPLTVLRPLTEVVKLQVRNDRGFYLTLIRETNNTE